MEKFAFIIHPLDAKDVTRKFDFTKNLPDFIVEGILRMVPPFKASQISGIYSKTSQAEGWFVACPLTTRQMVSLPQEFVIKRIIQAGKVAEKLGAKILGLGAYTKIIGDAGYTIAKHLQIPVTTGNSYTVATALVGLRQAAQLMGLKMSTAKVSIVGATGSIGRVCAFILAQEIRNMTLVARDEAALDELAGKLLYETGLAAKITTDVTKGLRDADIIITVTSSIGSVIEPEDLKPGAIICDIARPRDVSQRVSQERNDVLVIEGGLVEVPGDVNFNLNFGFPQQTAYACMAEPMILALEGRYESYTLGRELSIHQVQEISRLAKKHGFKVAGLRSFDRPLTLEDINRVKSNALHNSLGLSS